MAEIGVREIFFPKLPDDISDELRKYFIELETLLGDLLRPTNIDIVKSMIGDYAEIATGYYTGDGTTAKAITGVGFTPKYVHIVKRQTADGANTIAFFTTPEIIDDNVDKGSIELGPGVHRFVADAIVSLDADGFTVSDYESDLAPNATGTVYNYMCIG